MFERKLVHEILCSRKEKVTFSDECWRAVIVLIKK